MIRLVINGARGRMGTRIAALVAEDSRFAVVATIGRTGTIEGAEALERGAFDAIVDVSCDTGARAAAALGASHGSAVFVATTGLSADSVDAITEAAMRIPVMIAANTSVGIAVMKYLCRSAAELLGESYDVSLIEYHHTGKKDVPSGTALRLMALIEGASGAEKKIEKIVGIRAGDIIGEHSMRFAGPGEYLEITHRATSRDLFARGALRGCAWLVGQPPGVYEIEQALGLGPS